MLFWIIFFCLVGGVGGVALAAASLMLAGIGTIAIFHLNGQG